MHDLHAFFRKRLRLIGGERLHFTDVGAGDKGLVTGAGDQQYARCGIRGDLRHGLRQLVQRRRIERVQRLRPVDRQQINARFRLFEQQVLIGHAGIPCD